MVGRAPDGSVAKGEIRAQTRQVLVNIGAALDAARLGFEHVVSTNVYLSDIRHLGAADEVYREYFPKDFPARTVLESMLMGPDFIVEISAIAVNDLAEKEVIQPQGWQPPKPPVSHAVRAGDTLFLSAFEPVDLKSGKLAAMTIREQTTQVMRNQEEALRAAEETTWAAADLLEAWVRQYGVPKALYCDWKNVYKRKPTSRKAIEGIEPETQFGRMCAKLGSRIIAASSPQAKGRVERHHGTHQDRMIKKMRLQGIADSGYALHSRLPHILWLAGPPAA